MSGTGYIPDEPASPDSPDLMMAGPAPGPPPIPGNLRPYVRVVFDQGWSNSCVANAIAASIGILLARAGAWRIVSRLFIYYYARLALGAWGKDPTGKLLDQGCQPRDALRALVRMGVPDETKWTFDVPRKVSKRPSWLARMFARDAKFAYHRCSSVDEIKWALSLGRPVIIGLQIDYAFGDHFGPGVVTDFADQRVGGHMMTIVSDLPEVGCADVLNSWGESYRDGGFVKLSWQLIAREMAATEGIDAWAISF